MNGPLGGSKTNHASLWLTALLVAGAVTGIAYLLFVSFEHEAWFPGEWRWFLNENAALVFGLGGVALCLVLGVWFYARGTFTRKAGPSDGWASGPEPQRRKASFSAFSTGPSDWPHIKVVLRRNRRACHGDLVLTDKRFFFICYRDESLTRTVGGKAVAQQFGLLGALIQALVSRPGKKQQKDESARKELAGLSLEAQAEKSPYSLSLSPHEIAYFSHSTWGGTSFEAQGEKYSFLEIEKSDFPIVAAWCEQHGIETRGI